MARSRSGDYGCLTLIIVALVAHSCGEDDGKRSARRKYESEISSLESRHRGEVNDLEAQVRRLRANCPAEAVR